MNHLHSINQIIEKCREHWVKLQIAMIDYNKAFDTLRHYARSTENQGIPNKLVMIVNEMYSGLKPKIITDKEGRLFNIKKGVKQGNPLSPLLLNCALEGSFQRIDWTGKAMG